MTDEDLTGDGQTDDERAVGALFAALVRDSPPSEVSPLEVIRLAKTHTRAALDRRIARLKVGRNLLLAAAIVAVLALVLPHLGSSSTTASSALSSGSNAAAATSSSEATDAGLPALPAPAAAPAGSAAEGSSAGGSAGSRAAAGSGSPAVPGATSAAASSAASVEAPAGSSGAGVNGDAAGCIALPTAALQAARAALPAGSVGAFEAADGCTAQFGVDSGAGPREVGTVTIVLTRAVPGACRAVGPAGAGCSPVAGTADAYRSSGPGSRTQLFVYGAGYQVALTRAGAVPSEDQLVAAGRAVIKALG